jgi:hypothetical protein
MDDFEEAVETATLPTLLKQDLDLDLSGGGANTSVTEAELEKLMREMTAEDLDALVAEVGAGDAFDDDQGEPSKAGTVGLMVPDGTQTLASVEKGEVVGTSGSSATPAKAKGPTDKNLTESAVSALGSKVDDFRKSLGGGEGRGDVPPSNAATAGSTRAPSATSASGEKGQSKEETAEEMPNADSIDWLLKAESPVEGKEKVD